jgi:IS30 family transposase
MLTRYPLPQQITLDRGTEFMTEFAKMEKMITASN